MNRHHTQKGFTLIEMLVIAPIVVLAIGAFLTVIISMTGEVLSSRGSNALAFDVQDAMNRIEADVKLSTTFLATNNIALTTGGQQGYNNDDTSNFTNVGGTSGTSLILSELVTTGNPLSTSSSVVYLADKPNACGSASISDNTPMTMNVIYFVKNDPNNNNTPTLWRRTIMPSNYATSAARCSTPWQQPSCAPGYTSTFCKTNDSKLVAGVAATSFVLQYYTNSSATLPNATASDTGATTDSRNAALASSPTVGVSISASQTVAGRAIDRAATLRATRLDVNASTIATVMSDTTPVAPTGLVATYNNTPGQVTVSWYPNGAASYTLQYDTTNAFSSPTTLSNNTTTSRLITGLTSAPRYFFRVQAVNSLGTSDWSSTADVAVPITNGLIAWYRLNGNANEEMGSGYNGTVTNATLTTGQNGQANTAYNFNGSSAEITVSNAIQPTAVTEFSLSAWTKLSALNGVNTVGVISKDVSTGISNPPYSFEFTTASFTWRTTSSTDASVILACSGIVPATGVWYHLVGVLGSGTAKFYINGTQCTGTPAQTNIAATTGLLAIGQQKRGFARWLNGVVDDVRIYNRALSSSEVTSIYGAGAL